MKNSQKQRIQTKATFIMEKEAAIIQSTGTNNMPDEYHLHEVFSVEGPINLLYKMMNGADN